MWQEILMLARKSHYDRTGHTMEKIYVGLNFIECGECKKHAHITCDSNFVMHDAEYAIVQPIKPEEF